MLTKPDLEQAFHVYIPHLETIRTTKLYWPMLHVVLALPDICAALEDLNGETDGPRYMNWCHRYLRGNMDGADWWKMRCAVLHLGSSIPDQKRGNRKSKYASFSFGDPDHWPPTSNAHRNVETNASGESNIMLDIAALADELLVAMRAWFSDATNPALVEPNVRKNLQKLVRIQPKTLPSKVPGGPRTFFLRKRSITTSST